MRLLRASRPGPPGAWRTMPAKMMKLMPLPMPFSVMSSPIHISSDRAGGEGDHLDPAHGRCRGRTPPMIDVLRLRSADRMPNAWSSASGTVR